MRILIVDDESSLRLTLAANLELEGLEVVEASSGAEALDRLAEAPVDLVLSDIRMPGLSGVDLHRRIRARGISVPVILMTAFALEELERAAIEEGVFTVLPKPFEIAHVLTTLARASRCPLVLVVDDAKDAAETLVAALEKSGVRARAAIAGAEALEVVRSDAIDVCVVDLVLRGVEGADLIARIRGIDASIACFALSGEDAEELLRRLSAVGPIACMRKPVDPGELLAAIAAARGAAPPRPG